jgi:hypothetical protein
VITRITNEDAIHAQKTEIVEQDKFDNDNNIEDNCVIDDSAEEPLDMATGELATDLNEDDMNSYEEISYLTSNAEISSDIMMNDVRECNCLQSSFTDCPVNYVFPFGNTNLTDSYSYIKIDILP